MKRAVTVFLTVISLLVFASSFSFASMISVDSVVAEPGDHFPVGIYLSGNSIDIAGLVIPLRFDNSMLTVDSVSFVGSVKPQEIVGLSFNNLTTKVLRVSYLPDVSVLPIVTFNDASGLIANLWLTLSPLAQPGSIVIDSVNDVINLSDSVQLWTRIEITDSSGINFFLPDFTPGQVLARVPTDVEDPSSGLLPTSLELSQNYPNPFNPGTVISYSLPRSGHVDLRVYNLLGQEVSRLVDRFEEAGTHEVSFNASQLPSGVYFYRLSHNGAAQTKKMTLVK